MAGIPRNFSHGGKGLSPGGSSKPSLKQILDGLNSVPAWSAELTVTTHVVTLATAGFVAAVDATTATAAGGKTMQSAGSPAAGFVQVAYDASGFATLTFNATDAVTGAKVIVIPRGSSLI